MLSPVKNNFHVFVHFGIASIVLSLIMLSHSNLRHQSLE